MLANRNHHLQWVSDILQVSPSATYVLHRNFATCTVLTANPAVVEHILKTHFHNYGKGDIVHRTFKDFLGKGIFNVDGESWKFQRQVASYKFNTMSLCKFIETVVDTEISNRLIPIISSAAATGSTPPAYCLLFHKTKFAQAFEESVKISSERFNALIPIVWKMKKLLNIGSEKRLRIAVSEVQEFAKNAIKEKKHELREKSSLDSIDLLSRFLSFGHSDVNFVTDIVISFILAGCDTTSSALTWYLWLLSKNLHVESKVLKEIKEKSEAPIYDDVKGMVYTHASLCESMRLYPPVAEDSKEALNDDVLPDGMMVKKGMRVTYIPHATGRSEMLWGTNWAEFKPERWLEKDEAENSHWRFVGRDAYTYPVYVPSGAKDLLGEGDGVLVDEEGAHGGSQAVKVVPALEEGVEPEFVPQLTSQMKGGFPVRIVERDEKE